jgi:hypothetical protein
MSNPTNTDIQPNADELSENDLSTVTAGSLNFIPPVAHPDLVMPTDQKPVILDDPHYTPSR